MSTSDIPYQTFNCPQCGAPGSVSYGQASYTCMCRMRTFVTPTPQPVECICPKCGLRHGGAVQTDPPSF
jgi:hypothetical protein